MLVTGVRKPLCVTSLALALSAGFLAVPDATQVSHAVESPLSLSLSTPEAGVIHPGQDLVAVVSPTNKSNTPVGAGTIAFFLDRNPLTNATEIDKWIANDDRDPDDLGSLMGELPIGGVGAESVGPDIEFRVPASQLDLDADGSLAVFGIAAQYRSSEDVYAQTTGTIVWDAGSRARASFSIVLPLTTPPSSDGLIPPETLAAYTSPGGILDSQLSGVINRTNVAIGLDPMILASIRVLGSAAPASATTWLANMVNALNETFPLSYADSDLAVQFEAGLASPLQPLGFEYAIDPSHFTAPATSSPPTEQTPAATSPGSAPATPPITTSTSTPVPATPPPSNPAVPNDAELLKFPYSLSGMAWPGRNTMTDDTLEALARNGYSHVIIDRNDAVDGSRTPSSLRAGGVSAVVTSGGLSDALQRAVEAPSENAWRHAIGVASAHLALLGSSADNPQHSAVAALERAGASSGMRLGASIARLSELPWVNPVSLSEQLAYPSDSVELKETPEEPFRVATTRDLLKEETVLTQFATALDSPSKLTAPERNTILALLANGWRKSPAEWASAYAQHEEHAAATLGAIHIAPSSDVTQVGVEASIPVTIANDLGEPVSVVLRASPSNGRLQVQGTVDLSIEPHARKTARVPTTARIGNGEVTLSVDLFSRTGVRVAGPSDIAVNVRADWEGIGALFVAIFIVGFFGFGVFRTIRRRRRERVAGSAHPVDDGQQFSRGDVSSR